MSDLISREEALSHPFANGKYDKENANYDFILGFESYKEWLETLPTTSILDHARAIKDYCRDRNSLDEPCEGCPFHFYVGYRGYCRFESLPAEWDLPEGEKE